MSRANNKTINEYICFINDNINELKLNFRTEVLQIILYSIGGDKVIEKGNGCSIKFSDMDNELIKNIYNFISKKLEMSSDII